MGLARAVKITTLDPATHPKYIDLIEKLRCDEMPTFRRRLMAIESKFTEEYFSQIFLLFPDSIRPDGRKTFKAYDGLNNLFNLAYEMLSKNL